jgi:hypothetical protein
MNRKQAENKLYLMWEDGSIPSNFTQEHSEYSRAVDCLMEFGYLIIEDFFLKLWLQNFRQKL